MPSLREYSDKELFLLIKCRDEHAFTETYRRYWAILFRHARRMLRSDDDATDIIQDVFATLWSKADQIEPEISVSSYLYASTRNRVIDFINKGKRHDYYVSSLQEFVNKGSFITDNAVLEKELKSRIEKEIAGLPPKMRKTFELSRKHHLSYREIAEITDTSEGTVKKQIYNALKLLKPKFGINIFAFFFFFIR